LDLFLTPEQELLRDTAKKLVERDIQPVMDRYPTDRELPKSAFLEIFAKVAAVGLTAPRLPESAGGADLPMLDYGIMFEQIPPSVSMSMLAQDVCSARLYAECSPEQAARFLPDLIAGKRMGCTGSTEPDTGSDPRGIKTRVTQEGDTLILNGRKQWVTSVSQCDLAIITCLDHRTAENRNRVVKVVVERDKSPFEAREIEVIGLQQGLLGEAVFENVRVPAANLIDVPRGGTEVLKQSWNVNRPLIGLQCVHLAQRAFDAALEYAKVRKQFGKPIGAHQLVQLNLSDMATAIEASRMLCYRALQMVDRGEKADGAAAMAKRYAQVHCLEAARQAMNVFGAMGLSKEARIEQYFRDIRMLAIPDGTSEILALIHGRDLTGLEAFRGLPPRT
jgi:alkylation response protein AidB-like acyl-CoA dehydrogenase